MTVITRFPPSPTGYLHIGSVRTALYSWLYAKKHQGRMILRIEDTDQERSTPEAVAVILEGLQWLDLSWDEGPYFQTHRLARYQRGVHQLLDAGHAYRCTCTRERLQALREEQTAAKQKPKYDGRCRTQGIPADTEEPFVVRLKTPLSGTVTFQDAVKGEMVFQNSELDDLIIQRSDGMPTYQLAVVMDDWDMQITHVIRGDDHLTNTPRQIHILQALGAPLPVYAHIPMILGPDGARLSKRHGAVSVLQYREEGYLPEALLNYLVRLGWSHHDQEIFTRAEMIAAFDLDHIQRSAASFNPEKLLWLNQQYMKSIPLDRLLAQWQPFLEAKGWVLPSDVVLGQIATLLRERSATLVALTTAAGYFLEEELQYESTATQKIAQTEGVEDLLCGLKNHLVRLPQEHWQEEGIHTVLQAFASERQLAFGKMAQPLRWAVTGGSVSPPLAPVLAILGQTLVAKRLETAIRWLDSERGRP